MNIGTFKNHVKGMLEKELEGLTDTEEVTEELRDNLDVAFSAILDSTTDEDEDEEDDEDEENEDLDDE